jgi:DNA-binding MarR family transcriptional regulator
MPRARRQLHAASNFAREETRMPSSPVPSTPTSVLGDDLIRVVKLLNHARHQMPRHHPQVDPMAYPLLFNLKAGPLRVGALADLVHTDVSTVSRQVSTLVDLGFVTRGPDPDDGRAQALTLTDEGTALLHGIRSLREQWLQGLLADWDDAEVVAFSQHLRHFASTLEASLSTLPRRTD